MFDTVRPHERWIWTELIGFDNRLPDLGVKQYLQSAGFTPTVICLLLSSPDFVLSHEDEPGEVTLHEDFCSRDGHEFNPHRQRQSWTNRQLQQLIANLQARGVRVFLTVFTTFYRNRFHKEWLSDHPEACMVSARRGWGAALNCLSRLADGTFFEDYFIPKLAQTLSYYGFDGWHGADGWGPHSGPVYDVNMSDDMVTQFTETTGFALADEVAGPCGHDIEKLQARAEWLWQHCRHEWIEFYADRWTRFWRKALDTLHAAGKEAVINSSWGRAPWESLYRYGIDYRRIVDAGVDGIIVETVAAGLSMDPRPGAGDTITHFDFLSMLMLIRAYVPDTRLIFLHNTHDTVEEWDAIRHNPTVLEKEIYSLTNVFHTAAGGSLRPAADGFLVCLGDGLDDEHWHWLRRKWAQAFSGSPVRTQGAMLVWSDAVMRAQVTDFTHTRNQTVHRFLFHLMDAGAAVQTTVRVEDLATVSGPLLVINHHLMPPEELAQVTGYTGGPVILIGQPTKDLPEPAMQLQDVIGDGAMECAVYKAEPSMPQSLKTEETACLPANVMTIEEPLGYWDHFIFRPVSPGFLSACADIINTVAGRSRIVEGGENASLMATEEQSGVIRVALKSKSSSYIRPKVEMGREVKQVDIVTEYPSLTIRPQGSEFSVRVPPRGLTVVDVTLAADE